MPRWARFLIGIVALVYGVWQIRSVVSTVHDAAGDQTIEAAAAKAKAAASAFQALAQKAKPAVAVPRQIDPAAKPLLDEAFDTAALSGDRSLPSADLGPIGEWAAAVNAIGLLYLLAGTTITDIGKAAEDANANDQITRNAVTYAPEIGRYFDAEFTIGGALATIVSQMPSQGAKDDGARAKIASGFTQEIQGGMQTLTIDGLDDAWRSGRLRTLRIFAGKAVPLLRPSQCSGLRETAASVMRSLYDKDVRGGLQDVSDALKC